MVALAWSTSTVVLVGCLASCPAALGPRAGSWSGATTGTLWAIFCQPVAVRRRWDFEDLVGLWTLGEADRELVGNKYGATRLGFALLLRFFQLEGRFPHHVGELPVAAVGFVASQLGVNAAQLVGYDWSGRSIKDHRRQIRDALGFRVFTRGDEDKTIAWLAERVCPHELSPARLRRAVLERCRAERLEPPGRVDRIVAAASAAADEHFCATIVARLPAAAAAALEDLVAGGAGVSPTEGLFARLRAEPGQLGLATLLGEVDKLERVRALGLPADLFAGVAPTRLARWRARAGGEHPSTLRRDHPAQVRLTLLAVWCWSRRREVTDSLVDLLVALVHRVHTRARRRVERGRAERPPRSTEDEKVLLALARAVLDHPGQVVRDVVLPVVGEQRLRELVAQAETAPERLRALERRARTGSYTHHYRAMLPRLLGALRFRRHGDGYQPVIDAVELLRRHIGRDARDTHYETGERVPLDGVVTAEWREIVVDEDGRVERAGYEMCVLDALREGIRRRRIWVDGAARWGDPAADLPADFDQRRGDHYAALGQPPDPAGFVAAVRGRLETSLASLAEGIHAGSTGGVRVGTREGQAWVTVPRLGAQPAPANLDHLKAEVIRRWGVLSLLDVLKEADWLTDLHTEFSTVATREQVPPGELRRRLVLVLFALGTNIGIRRVVQSGDHQPQRGPAMANPP